jgi:hypothetical protein
MTNNSWHTSGIPTYVYKSDYFISPITPVSSTNTTDRRDVTDIVLKVAVNTITLNPILHHQ